MIPIIQHPEGTKWYNHEYNETIKKINNSELQSTVILNDLKPEQLEKFEKLSEQFLIEDSKRFEAWYRSKNVSKVKWFDEVARAGTFADRMSVVQLRMQISPVHSLHHIKNLIESFHKKGLRESNTTLMMLKELFLNDLLPSKRTLYSLSQRPLKNYLKVITDNIEFKRSKDIQKRLILWKFETNLKELYLTFVQSLELLAGNAVLGIAENACSVIQELLLKHSEQENLLLNALVNKLGHPSRKIGSKVALLLQKIVEKSSNKRLKVIDAACQLIFRKNILPNAQYYAVHFLNHIYLRAGEFDLALRLIKTYLNLFKIVIQKGELEHNLIPLLITGTNRAIPYTKSVIWSEGGILSNEIDHLYSLVPTTKLSIALNVLKLLFNIHNKIDGLPDRFYTSFYRRLLTIKSSSLNMSFFGFFLKAVKNDGVNLRVQAFLKRLFQIALASTAPEFTVAALLIAGMIIKERSNLLNLTNSITKLQNIDCKNEFFEQTEFEIKQTYDPHVRNPLFSKADLALNTELLALSEHYHPSVAIFAKKLLAGDPVNYDGDPLEDFNSINFLERFSFKNPKRKDKTPLVKGLPTKKLKFDELGDISDENN